MNAAQRKTHRAVWLLLAPLLLAFLLFAGPGSPPYSAYSAPENSAAPPAASALGLLP